MAQLSRRGFAHLVGTAAAATALESILPLQAKPHPAASGVPVRLSANENPFGPSPLALQAVRDAFPRVRLYPDEAVDQLVSRLATSHGVSESQVLLGDGSSEILKLAAMAFTGPGKALVVADPTFEALVMATSTTGATVKKVPLLPSFAHDVTRMLEESRGAGLVYVCNPNNPTATITPDKALREFIDAVPSDTVILVDEAYHHYASSELYASVADLVPKRGNLIVSRTFSKIYGLAGLRCGYCLAGGELIVRLHAQQAWDTVNVLGLVAAAASLGDRVHVTEHRRRNSETRAWLGRRMESLGLSMLPSQANFAMIDLRRDVQPVIAALRSRGVSVGRRFPAMPQHLRVTIGRPEEMRRLAAELTLVLRS